MCESFFDVYKTVNICLLQSIVLYAFIDTKLFFQKNYFAMRFLRSDVM